MKKTYNKKYRINRYLFKTTTISLLFVLCTNIATAQLSQYIAKQDSTQTLYTIKAGMDLYLDSLATIQDSATFYAEGGEYIEYMKFMDYWESRLYPHGNFSKVFDANSAFYTQNQDNYQYKTDKPWHEIGPFDRPGGSSDGVGPVEYLSIFDDGTTESTRHMLVASLLGGVFYSSNYGESWNSTSTDTQWELSGSGCAIFSPTDHSTWFASSSGNSNSGYSLWIGKTGGIYRTTDEGVNWYKIADYNNLGGQWNKIFKLLIVPGNPDALFAVTSSGIYRSINYNDPNLEPEWDKVMDGLSYDLEIQPGNNLTLYSTAFINDAWQVMKSIDGGVTWNELQSQPQFVDSSDIKHSSFTIEVSKAKPEYLYCLVNNNYFADLYYYDFNNSGNWNQVSTDEYKMNFGMGHGFGVDQITSGEKVITSYWITKKIFNIYTPDEGTDNGQHHSDVEDILFHPYNPEEIWLCTHGGVEKSVDGGQTWQTKYTGLSVANVEEMATSITNPELIMIGLYHDHTQLTQTPYSENWLPDWDESYKFGDGMRPLIDPINPNYMWASRQKGGWQYSTDKFVSNSQGRYFKSDFFTEGVLNKVDPSKMYRHAFNTNNNDAPEVYYTESNGNNNLLSSFYQFYPNGYYVIGLYTPFTNGNYLLITIKDSLTNEFFLYRTTNVNDSPQNVQWTELLIPRHDGGIATIDFDPNDENIVYLVYSNTESTGDYATEMVYQIDYTVPSSPVFNDITKNLPNTTTGKDCIEIDNGGTRGIYLYTAYGIFYTNTELINNGFDCWQKYGTKLPHVRGGSLEINYVCNKLRAGLYGRGVWEIDIPCITDLVDVNIETNTTWDENISIAGIVTIESQNELTIQNSVISFGPDAKIIVKQGAKLIINNARLTYPFKQTHIS